MGITHRKSTASRFCRIHLNCWGLTLCFYSMYLSAVPKSPPLRTIRAGIEANFLLQLTWKETVLSPAENFQLIQSLFFVSFCIFIAHFIGQNSTGTAREAAKAVTSVPGRMAATSLARAPHVALLSTHSDASSW